MWHKRYGRKAGACYLFAIVFIVSISSVLRAQPVTNYNGDFLDFSAVDAYFLLADKMKQKIEPKSQDWDRFFKAPINALMILARALDTTQFKKDMHLSYGDENISWEHINDEGLRHHYKYKKYAADLRQHIDHLKASNVLDSILKHMHAYLPKRLSGKRNIPKQYYVFYLSEDATGGPDMVIVDLLLSYRVDKFRLGLISAHETFHSIVSRAFADTMLSPANDNRPNNDLLHFLSNISQEGIADLIDKPLLMNTGSPVKDETDQLFENELALTAHYISKLDSILKGTDGDFTQPFHALFENFSRNGGHIPGRLMGKAIKDCALLPDLLPQIEDPILFIELYNKAVLNCRLDLPHFSKESITYLDRLRQRYFRR